MYCEHALGGVSPGHPVSIGEDEDLLGATALLFGAWPKEVGIGATDIMQLVTQYVAARSIGGVSSPGGLIDSRDLNAVLVYSNKVRGNPLNRWASEHPIFTQTAATALTIAPYAALGGGAMCASPTKPPTLAAKVPNIEWVREPSSMIPENAAFYQAETIGSRPGFAPRLSAVDAEGIETAKFDGYNPATNTMIDRKLNTYGTPKFAKEALRQSATAAKNGMRVRWEFPDARAARSAERILSDLGITNIEVRIVGSAILVVALFGFRDCSW